MLQLTDKAYHNWAVSSLRRNDVSTVGTLGECRGAIVGFVLDQEAGWGNRRPTTRTGSDRSVLGSHLRSPKGKGERVTGSGRGLLARLYRDDSTELSYR